MAAGPAADPAPGGVVGISAGELVPPVDCSTIGAGVSAVEQPAIETATPMETSAPSTPPRPLTAHPELPERDTAMLAVFPDFLLSIFPGCV
jgi:hypothetical protein